MSWRLDLNGKTAQQRHIITNRDKNNKVAVSRTQINVRNYKTSIFIKLGIDEFSNNGVDTINLYKFFLVNNNFTWFSTNSLNKGMAKNKVDEFNNTIDAGYNVWIYFCIGSKSGGTNDIMYRAKVSKLVSNKEKIISPDITNTPNEFSQRKNYIWIKIYDLKDFNNKMAKDFIVESTGSSLHEIIKKSQFHFGYIKEI